MEVLQLDELLNLREYLMTLTDPNKYLDADNRYIKGAIDAYNHIIEGIDTRIKIMKIRGEK